MTSRVLILLFGALPSLILSFLAGVLIYFTAGGRSWWPAVWGAVGIVSSAPFWALSFGPAFLGLSKTTRAVYIVLLALGIVSATPLLFSNWIFALLAVSPMLTGVGLLFMIGLSDDAQKKKA